MGASVALTVPYEEEAIECSVDPRGSDVRVCVNYMAVNKSLRIRFKDKNNGKILLGQLLRKGDEV